MSKLLRVAIGLAREGSDTSAGGTGAAGEYAAALHLRASLCGTYANDVVARLQAYSSQEKGQSQGQQSSSSVYADAGCRRVDYESARKTQLVRALWTLPIRVVDQGVLPQFKTREALLRAYRDRERAERDAGAGAGARVRSLSADAVAAAVEVASAAHSAAQSAAGSATSMLGGSVLGSVMRSMVGSPSPSTSASANVAPASEPAAALVSDPLAQRRDPYSGEGEAEADAKLLENTAWPFFLCPVLGHDLSVLAVSAVAHGADAPAAQDLAAVLALARLVQLLLEPAATGRVTAAAATASDTATVTAGEKSGNVALLSSTAGTGGAGVGACPNLEALRATLCHAAGLPLLAGAPAGAALEALVADAWIPFLHFTGALRRLLPMAFGSTRSATPTLTAIGIGMGMGELGASLEQQQVLSRELLVAAGLPATLVEVCALPGLTPLALKWISQWNSRPGAQPTDPDTDTDTAPDSSSSRCPWVPVHENEEVDAPVSASRRRKRESEVPVEALGTASPQTLGTGDGDWPLVGVDPYSPKVHRYTILHHPVSSSAPLLPAPLSPLFHQVPTPDTDHHFHPCIVSIVFMAYLFRTYPCRIHDVYLSAFPQVDYSNSPDPASTEQSFHSVVPLTGSVTGHSSVFGLHGEELCCGFPDLSHLGMRASHASTGSALLIPTLSALVQTRILTSALHHMSVSRTCVSLVTYHSFICRGPGAVAQQVY